MNHANSILETFEYFCQITSKSIVTISSYTVSKLGRFFETLYNRFCMIHPWRMDGRTDGWAIT